MNRIESDQHGARPTNERSQNRQFTFVYPGIKRELITARHGTLEGAAPQLAMFNPIVPEERLNRLFRIVAGSRQHVPARQELQATFDRLPKPDGNFIKDFQTTGFSARIWELVFAAYAGSIGAVVAQPHERLGLPALQGSSSRFGLKLRQPIPRRD